MITSLRCCFHWDRCAAWVRSGATTIAVGLLLNLLLSGALVAQNSPPEDSAARNNQLGQELLKSLEDFRQQQNPVMPDLRLPSASAIPGESPEQQRLRSIQQRLELIRTLVQQRQEAEASKKQSTSRADSGSPPAPKANTTAPGKEEPKPEAKPAAQPQPEFPLPELGPGPEATATEKPASTPPKYLGQTVVPAAVDPLELANSLFQTGNYELALKTYLAVADSLDKPQDALWTEYFIASCRRILGDLPNAEKGYRGLVESRRPTRPVEAARWWLDNVERRKNIETTITQIDSYLQAVSKELSPNGK
ncbi:MAG: hypothetical protein ACK53V_05230 [Planctomycetota bacterium]